MKEVDKLTKKLDNISFTKRVKNTHLKTEEKPNCQIIKE